MDFLSIETDALKVELSPYGAALARVWLRGHASSLVLGLERPEDYANAPDSSGVIVGPVAGRVAKGHVSLNGRSYQMPQNTPPDCLHSGPGGIQHHLWSVKHHDQTIISLETALKDGECGLPGQRKVQVTYSVTNASLSIDITAQSSEDTPFNATSHAYWSLDDAADLSTHRLQVCSTDMCETGADLIPSGRVVSVAGTEHDFSAPNSPVAGRPFDGCFCFDPAHRGLLDRLELVSSRSHVRLRMQSDQPGVVLYTGENLTTYPAPAHTPRSQPFSALAIEAQGWPDAVNHSNFPTILLKKGEVKQQKTIFSFALPH